jgi:hypothetical protein
MRCPLAVVTAAFILGYTAGHVFGLLGVSSEPTRSSNMDQNRRIQELKQAADDIERSIDRLQ